MMRAIRRFLYRHGHRPPMGSIFHSPYLAWGYAVAEAARAAAER